MFNMSGGYGRIYGCLMRQYVQPIWKVLVSLWEGEKISKDGKTDAVSLGKAEEASNVLVSVETEEACIATSFLLGTFGLSEEMEVGSEEVEGIFSSLCCLIFLSKARFFLRRAQEFSWLEEESLLMFIVFKFNIKLQHHYRSAFCLDFYRTLNCASTFLYLVPGFCKR